MVEYGEKETLATLEPNRKKYITQGQSEVMKITNESFYHLHMEKNRNRRKHLHRTETTWRTLKLSHEEHLN